MLAPLPLSKKREEIIEEKKKSVDDPPPPPRGSRISDNDGHPHCPVDGRKDGNDLLLSEAGNGHPFPLSKEGEGFSRRTGEQRRND